MRRRRSRPHAVPQLEDMPLPEQCPRHKLDASFQATAAIFDHQRIEIALDHMRSDQMLAGPVQRHGRFHSQALGFRYLTDPSMPGPGAARKNDNRYARPLSPD